MFLRWEDKWCHGRNHWHSIAPVDRSLNPIAADAVVCFSFADREKKTLALLVYFSYRLLGGSKAARRTREALHKLGFFFYE